MITVRVALLLSLILVLSACTQQRPPLPVPTPAQQAASPAAPTVPTLPSDPNDFRSFVKQISDAIPALNVQFFTSNTTFTQIKCSQPPGPPSLPLACASTPSSSTNAILTGVLQSDGFYMDRAEYQTFIETFLVFLQAEVDNYGPMSPKVFATATLKPQFRTSTQGTATMVALASCGGCITPGHPTKGAMPPQGRLTLIFESAYDGKQWRIIGLKIGGPNYLDPASQESKELFESWQKW